METYSNYRGYGITYTSMNGNTSVDHYGTTLHIFYGVGESTGKKLAMDYIDRKYKTQ